MSGRIDDYSSDFRGDLERLRCEERNRAPCAPLGWFILVVFFAVLIFSVLS